MTKEEADDRVKAREQKLYELKWAIDALPDFPESAGDLKQALRLIAELLG